jgi:hypothetical protein
MNVYSLQQQWSDDIVTRAKLKASRPDHCYNCGRPFHAFVVQKINPNWMAERCQHCKADVCYTRVITVKTVIGIEDDIMPTTVVELKRRSSEI